MQTVKCPVCGQGARVEPDGKGGGLEVECPVCTHYWVSGSAAAVLRNRNYEGARHLISAATRKSWNQYSRRLKLTADASGDRLEDVIAANRVRKGPAQRIDLLVQAMYHESGAAGDIFALDSQTCYPMAFARDKDEFAYVRGEAIALGYVATSPQKNGFVLSTVGWQHAEELQKARPDSNQAFVAMSGKPEMKDGKCVRLHGTFQDITERKQAEEALEESEEKFRMAFDNANTGMCLVGLDGVFL